MKALLVINLLVVICVLLSESAIIGDSSDLDQELFVYKEQVRIVYQLLAAECPEEVRSKRETENGEPSTLLEVNKLHLKSLVRRLNKCRTDKKIGIDTNATTPYWSRADCQYAKNLNDSWRLDHDGKDLKAGGPNAHPLGYACDFREDVQWFRFTGEAGSRMLNKCPKVKSCGADIGMWTDEPMPTALGEAVFVSVYGSASRDYKTNCKAYNALVQVQRCSMDTDHGFIYRYIGYNDFHRSYPDNCEFAFCGMQ